METAKPCCCCLLRSPLKDLNTPYSRLGVTEIYSQMFEDCFKIQLALDSDAGGMCEVCVGRLRDASDFKLQAQRSQAELRAMLDTALQGKDEAPIIKKEVEDSDNLLIKEEINVTIHVEPAIKTEPVDKDAVGESVLTPCTSMLEATPGHTPDWSVPVCGWVQPGYASVKLECPDEAPHACASCPATFDLESSLATHMRDVHDASIELFGLRTEEAYTCDTCGEQFTGKLSLAQHIHLHMVDSSYPHNIHTGVPFSHEVGDKQFTNRNLERKRGQSGEKPFTCEVCNKHFGRKSVLNEHMRVHTGEKPFSCEVCNKRFSQSGILKKHMSVHTGQKPFKCKICDKQFRLKESLTAHIKMHEGQKDYGCETCNKQFLTKRVLEEHKRTHTGQKPYSCEICKKQYSTQHNLNQHMRLHTGCFSCEICNKQFPTKSKLRLHNLSHTGEKHYTCETCNKQFITKYLLKVHNRVHTGEYPFSCDICNKRFTQKHYLKNHMVTHERVRKSVSCELCNKQFTSKCSLKVHMITHTGEKPHRCDICNKQFALKTTLTRHTKAIHNKTPQYSCVICDKLFTDKDYLKRHIRTHTNCETCHTSNPQQTSS